MFPHSNAESAGPFLGDPDLLESQQTWHDVKLKKKVRHDFISKVYGLLLAQIGLTILVAGYFTFNRSAQIWGARHASLIIGVSAAATLAILLVLTCVPGMARKHPANLIALFLFTLCEAMALGLACGMIALTQSVTAVMQAFLCTAVIVIGLTIFARQTKYDFTKFTGLLTVSLMGLLAMGLLRVLFPRSTVLETLYAVGGAVIFSSYIVVDTQLLIGEKQLEVSEDDYVMITLSLYLDIINLFVTLLNFFSQDNDSR